MKHLILIAFLALLSQPASAQLAQQWAKTFDDPMHGYNAPTAIALTASGCVVVTGTTYDTTLKIYHAQTIKYDPSGNVLWQTEFPSPLNCNPTAITTDAQGNIFISVDIFEGLDNRFHVLKYNCSGKLVWNAVDSTNPPGRIQSGGSFSQRIALDGKGNIFVGATSGCINCDSIAQSINEEPTIVKFDSNGNYVTEMRIRPALTVQSLEGIGDLLDGMHIVSNKTIYAITNLYQDSLPQKYGPVPLPARDFPHDFALAKYDTSGRREFLKRLWRSTKNDFPVGLFVGKNEDIFITGWTMDTTANAKTSYLTAKLDSSGNILYVKERGNATWSSQGRSIVADALGYAYVAGYTFEHGATAVLELIKYDPKGNEVWVKTYNSTFANSPIADGIHIDAQANIYINAYSSNGNKYECFVLKYDSSGSLIGEYHINTTSSVMAVNSSGEIFVTGSSQGANGYDFLTVKYGFPTSVTGDNQCLGTSVSESKSADNTFSIYPDPANEFISVNWQFTENKKVDLKIIDIKGEEVLHTTANGPVFRVDIRSLPSGLYVVILSADGITKSEKISVQK